MINNTCGVVAAVWIMMKICLIFSTYNVRAQYNSFDYKLSLKAVLRSFTSVKIAIPQSKILQ